MKKLFAAFAFVGLMACGSEAPAPQESPLEAAPTAPAEAPPALDLQFEAAAKVCPIYAPRCCGYLRPDGTCVGNCVARNAECP
jgi:hypothetical protein